MMKYKGYTGQVEFDAEAGILHGEVVGIRDVVTFQGASVKEVEKTFRDSVEDRLSAKRPVRKTARPKGRSVGRPAATSKA